MTTPMGYMAVAITLGFFGTLAALLFVDVDPTMKDPVMLMLGALIGNFGSVVSYYFGTTQGSAKKDETIQDLTKTASAIAATTQATQVAEAVAAAPSGPPIKASEVSIDAAGASISIDKGKP